MKHPIVFLPVIDSTNNYANTQLFGKGLTEGTVFLAHEQTAGRGQRGSSWESEPGMNLTFSLVLMPDFLDIRRQFLISKVVCLGISDCVAALVGPTRNVCVKWPNDIFVGDRKICGTLIENAVMNGVIRSSVIGIGLNVNQTAFGHGARNPVSLAGITGKAFDLNVVLDGLLRKMDFYYEQLCQGREELIDQRYEEKLYLRNEWHSFRKADVLFRGKITGVNDIGQLRIELENGDFEDFHLKEVEFVK